MATPTRLRIQDAFTVSSDTLLTNHTPTALGIAWAEFQNTASLTASAIATSDTAVPSGSFGNGGFAYNATPAPVTADQAVEIKLSSLANEGGVFVRASGAGSMYALAALSGGLTTGLFYFNGASRTTLDSYSTALSTNDRIKLEVVGTALKGYVNDVEQLSATDSNLSAAGDWGLFWGDLRTSSQSMDVSNNMEYDDFKAWDDSTAARSRVLLLGVG